MKLKRSYTFLYMPDDHGESRHFRLPRWLIVGCAACVLVLGTVSVLYAIGVKTGNSWLPGGSKLQRENLALNRSIDGLSESIDHLRTEVDGVYEVQNKVAQVINLPRLDGDTFAAGVGGRRHVEFASLASNNLDVDLLGGGDLGEHLDQMLRQAKIQRQGYLAKIGRAHV